MKNKKLTYILIPVAIIVWGGIILRIVGFNTNDSNSSAQNENTQYSDTLEFEKNDFELVTNYRDPFLGKFIKGTHSISKKPVKSKKVNPKPKKKEVIVWPHIDYDGSISNDSRVIAVLKINQKKFLLQQGEEMNGLTIKKVFKDSVLISYKKETKTFSK